MVDWLDSLVIRQDGLRLIGQLDDWLTGGLDGWMVEWLGGWMNVEVIGCTAIWMNVFSARGWMGEFKAF